MAVSTAFVITVDGTALPDDVAGLLVQAVVDDSLRLPDLFELRFRDPDRMVVAKGGFEVGAAVVISVLPADSQTPAKLITGEVTSLEVEFDTAGTFTAVRGYDAAHRLFRGRRTTSYTQVTAADVVSAVAQRVSLPTGTVESTTTVHDHVSQAGSTDWDFLEGLAAEIGYELRVKDGKLDFGKPTAAGDAPTPEGDGSSQPLVLAPGRDLLRIRASITAAEQVKEVQVRGWDVAQKKALVATAPAKTDSADLADTTPAGLAHVFGDPVHVASDVPYRTQAEVDVAATALADRIAGTFAEVHGVARGNPALRAGSAVTLDHVGAPFDGGYSVTTSRHVYDAGDGYTTAFAVTGRQERSLYGLAGGGGSAPPGDGGVVVGVVTDVKDPQQQGRVKLKFPWLSDDYVSDWSRTVQPGAGKDRGGLCLPEVGDEVLVAFEQGDVRVPYVIGGLYNGVDTPKSGSVDLVDGNSGAVNRRSTVSRRGHRIDLLDQDGKTEGITLVTGDDKLKLVMDVSGTAITVHSDGSVTVEGKQGVVVDSGSSKLELKGGQVSVSATSGVTIDGGGGAVKVTSGSELSLKGTTATLEGSGQAEVKGGAMCSISAAMVKIN